MGGVGSGGPAKPAGQTAHPSRARARKALPSAAVTSASSVPQPICGLSKVGEGIWAAMWALPEAEQWHRGDVPALSRLVALQEDRENWTDSRLLAEMRQLEDRFGLNASARRHLGWDDAADKAPAVVAGRAAPSVDRKAEALRLLRGQTG